MFAFIRRPDGGYLVRTDLRGRSLYGEPLLNKGTAFTADERRRLGVEALLPVRETSIEYQAARTFRLLSRLQDPFEKFIELEQVRDRNEHLFYRVLKDHLVELLPIVYTPTVARAVRLFSTTFRRAHGVWITPLQRGRIRETLRAAIGDRHIRLIVLTDNESILGIGDQGAGGIAIANGKIALYCAGAGIHPAEALAVSFDVGTDNEELLAHEAYLGVRAPRLRGHDYFSLLDEAVEAIRDVAPCAVLQWEDFRNNTAIDVLERYVDVIPSFNDDIQGTGAIALAGILAAGRTDGVPLADRRVVVFGGGAAGYGVARQVTTALRGAGLDPAEAAARVAVLDSQGLIVRGGRPGAPYKDRIALDPEAASALGLAAGDGLATVVARFRPTVLVGTSGQPGSFTREIVAGMLAHVARPVIMPMSNPTELAEADPADVLAWTSGRALVGTGSPCAPVEIEGRTMQIGQGNNAFIFPALGLAALITKARRIDDEWLTAAAEAVANAVMHPEAQAGLIYPDIARLPEVLSEVAAALVAHATGVPLDQARNEATRAAWQPVYPDVE